MLERLIENTDLKKLASSPNLKKILTQLFDKENFLEIVQDKQIMLGLKNRHGCEAIHVEDPKLLDFLRDVRDNLHPWRELLGTRRTAHKQLQSNLLKSNLFDFFKVRFDAHVLKDSLKISKKLHDFDLKMESLHNRLQGVFIVSGNKKEATGAFDNKNSVVVSKIQTTEKVSDMCWVREARYATVVIICPDDAHIHKYLRQSEFEKLVVDKKKCKNIWAKNHK